MTARRAHRFRRWVSSTCRDLRRDACRARELRKQCASGAVEQPVTDPAQTPDQGVWAGSTSLAGDPYAPRRQFLEDVLDVMGDADRITLPDGSEVTRIDLLTALAEEMDR